MLIWNEHGILLWWAHSQYARSTKPPESGHGQVASISLGSARYRFQGKTKALPDHNHTDVLAKKPIPPSKKTMFYCTLKSNAVLRFPLLHRSIFFWYTQIVSLLFLHNTYLHQFEWLWHNFCQTCTPPWAICERTVMCPYLSANTLWNIEVCNTCALPRPDVCNRQVDMCNEQSACIE